jgi:hypothetical protein
VVIIITGILRKRFAAGGRPWVWRALHATAYLAWPMAILHGLLAGRAAKPYVDWSYGACLAAVGLALTIRRVAMMRGRHLTGQPAPDPLSQPMRAPTAMPAGPFGELGIPSMPTWTGPPGPATPQRLAPRALEQRVQSWPGADEADNTWPGVGYPPWIRTFPGEEN